MRALLRAVAGVALVASALAGCGTPDTPRAAAATCAPVRSLATGTSARTLRQAGSTRTYLMRVPPGYDGTRRAPVVMLFHGLGGNPATMMQTTRMAEIADDEGFILVAPQGRGIISRWDFRSPEREVGSDLGFVKDVVADVERSACVDTARMYAVGFSNGSALTLALACHGSTKFAAYGAVSAPYYEGSCAAAPPASIIYFHGMLDKVVPYGGARTVIGVLPPVSSTMSRWAAHDGCPSAGATTSVSEHVRHFAWTACRDGSAVQLYAVDDGGHRWPGGASGSAGRVDGLMTQKIDASTLMWQFFTEHPTGGH